MSQFSAHLILQKQHLQSRFRWEVCRTIFNMTLEDTKRGLALARTMRGGARDFNVSAVNNFEIF
jgi:hypothetical protein